jgi:hypothetical protein
VHKINSWQNKLNLSGLKIGINWQGSQSKVDFERSFSVSFFKDLSNIQDVRLISLQKGYGSEQLDKLKEEIKIESLGQEFDEGDHAFIDTAAVMKCLDLIITSDTSIAHLAGALGVPCWVVLKYVPDWRWMMDRTDSPWYPSLRLFRQKERNNWAQVFLDINIEVMKLMVNR